MIGTIESLAASSKKRFEVLTCIAWRKSSGNSHTIVDAPGHKTACKRAGITNFRVHDWRHHWACQCVMAGIDLETIRQEGGWKSLRMVERYATVSAEHRARTMKKLK